MTLLDNLTLQTIDPSDDSSSADNSDDEIDLNDSMNDGKLEQYWDKVVDDLHKDPNWYKFDN